MGGSQLGWNCVEYGSRCPDVLRVAIAGQTTKDLDEPGGQTSLCSSSCSPNAETVRCIGLCSEA